MFPKVMRRFFAFNQLQYTIRKHVGAARKLLSTRKDKNIVTCTAFNLCNEL